MKKSAKNRMTRLEALTVELRCVANQIVKELGSEVRADEIDDSCDFLIEMLDTSSEVYQAAQGLTELLDEEPLPSDAEYE
jgi:hypothetical protein